MKERIVALGILVFALVYLAGSLSLKVGELAKPGAGQFPAAIAFCLLAVAAFNALRAFRKTDERGEETRWASLAPVGIAAALVVYPFLLKALSFFLSTFIVLFILFRLLRFKTVLTSFMTALFTTLLSLIVFTGLLGVILPAGIIEEFILKIMGLD